jgi:hypothetical protein
MIKHPQEMYHHITPIVGFVREADKAPPEVARRYRATAIYRYTRQANSKLAYKARKSDNSAYSLTQ